MKKIRLIILVLFMLFPLHIDAHELVCDTAMSKNYGESFNCYVKLNALTIYDEISGTITSTDNVKCSIFRFD